jgi:apolipoprotein D and lipocalin family protein
MSNAPALKIILTIAMTAGLSACLTASGPGGAPPPIAHVDMDKLYTGDWHEIAYRPTWLTKGCVAGITRFTPTDDPKKVGVRDSCRKKSVEGKERAVNGSGLILDPGTNARIRVTYFPLLSRTTEIAALATDYTWFITVTPDMGEANIFTRSPQVSPELKADLTGRVKRLGYDVTQLYFPPQPER